MGCGTVAITVKLRVKTTIARREAAKNWKTTEVSGVKHTLVQLSQSMTIADAQGARKTLPVHSPTLSANFVKHLLQPTPTSSVSLVLSN